MCFLYVFLSDTTEPRAKKDKDNQQEQEKSFLYLIREISQGGNQQNYQQG